MTKSLPAAKPTRYRGLLCHSNPSRGPLPLLAIRSPEELVIKIKKAGINSGLQSNNIGIGGPRGTVPWTPRFAIRRTPQLANAALAAQTGSNAGPQQSDIRRFLRNNK
jgi:hypothetical protein